jgi:acyl dehydratase
MTDRIDLTAVSAYLRGQTYQEMTPGSVFRTAGRTITEADLVSFVSMAGLVEPLFLDENGAKAQGYTGRLVPGTLTFAYAEGLVMQTGTIHNTGIAFLGTTMDVKGPVFVGDTITVVVEVLESRATSKGDRGIVTTRNTVVTGGGTPVMVYEPKRMVLGG